MPNRFVSDSVELQQIDLGDGDWVKIPKQLSFGAVTSSQDPTNPGSASVNLLMKAIKEWNLKDETGNTAPINKANVANLDVSTGEKISKVIQGMIIHDPKASIG